MNKFWHMGLKTLYIFKRKKNNITNNTIYKNGMSCITFLNTSF